MRHLILLILIVIYVNATATTNECETNTDCQHKWPDTMCRRGKCQCPANSLRRDSQSRGWVCLSLFDAVTASLGPPLTCPLPAGAGYRLILKDVDGKIVFCRASGGPTPAEFTCPIDYECIKAIGTFSDQWDGVCCPQAKLSCLVNKSIELKVEGGGGRLERWSFDGSKCVSFKWDPEQEENVTSNNFLSQSQCQSYCN